MSNIKNYKYDWIWEKEQGTGFARSKFQPLRKHEIISVFYTEQPFFDNKGEKLYKPKIIQRKDNSNNSSNSDSLHNSNERTSVYTYNLKHSILRFTREKGLHPTQKPIKLYKWLLDNYAKEGDKILDTHLGSGSIALACHDYKFQLTACELDEDYFDKAIERIKRHVSQQKLF
jgi:site-specific DNA-methyltransferase (adenine-specific)